MDNEKTITSGPEIKKRKWIKEQGDENGNKRIEVKELDEGFLIRISHDYKGKDGDWHYDVKEYARMENPLFPEQSKQNVFDLMDELFANSNY